MSNDPSRKTSNRRDDYIKYSGMAMQMGFIIGLFVFAGLRLDDWMETRFIFVLLGSLTGVGLALYTFIRQAYADDNK
ncbi:MAG: AtpZ/AtpI family protein [Aureispira sp.]